MCRSEWSEWTATLLLLVAWHLVRCAFCVCEGGGTFTELVTVYTLQDAAEDKARRNKGHNALGVYHCIGVLLLTSLLLFQHQDESWDDWFGLREPGKLDANHIMQPWWPLAFSGSYFLSDLIFINDFPVFWLHHIVSVVLITSCLEVVEMRFCGVVILFWAEVGGFLLSLYYRMPTDFVYGVFCLGYGASRVAFSYVIMLPSHLSLTKYISHTHSLSEIIQSNNWITGCIHSCIQICRIQTVDVQPEKHANGGRCRCGAGHGARRHKLELLAKAYQEANSACSEDGGEEGG